MQPCHYGHTQTLLSTASVKPESDYKEETTPDKKRPERGNDPIWLSLPLNEHGKHSDYKWDLAEFANKEKVFIELVIAQLHLTAEVCLDR